MRQFVYVLFVGEKVGMVREYGCCLTYRDTSVVKEPQQKDSRRPSFTETSPNDRAECPQQGVSLGRLGIILDSFL